MFLLQLVGVKGKGPRQRLSPAGPTRRRDDGPASPGSSTSAIAGEVLRRHARSCPVRGRAASPRSDEPAWSREASSVVERRQSKIVEVDSQVAKPPQRRLD